MRQIDMSKGLENLSREDLLYLRDRGRLTPEQEAQYLSEEDAAPTAPEPNPPSTPTTGDTGPAPDTGGNEDDGGSEPTDNYDDEDAWSYKDLQAEAKKRELPAGGSRDEIIVRLRADDAEDAEGGES